MFSILVHCRPDEEDALVAELWEAGTTGIVEEPGGIRAFFENGVPIERLTEAMGRAPVSVRIEEPTDWAQVSHNAFPPVNVGQRFFLVAPFRGEPTPEGRLRLEINPGMACGTGYHPCTQLCLEAMEQHLIPGSKLLDVGAGSGILSEAALLLGAGLVIGCDIDPDAIEVARERIGTPLFVGSVDAVRSGAFDAIVANISSATVEALAVEFRRVGKAGATFIVSGFSGSDMPDAFHSPRILRKDGWVCLVARNV